MFVMKFAGLGLKVEAKQMVNVFVLTYFLLASGIATADRESSVVNLQDEIVLSNKDSNVSSQVNSANNQSALACDQQNLIDPMGLPVENFNQACDGDLHQQLLRRHSDPLYKLMRDKKWYIKEVSYVQTKQQVHIRDPNNENRLADMTAGIINFRTLDVDPFRFNTGDPSRDAELERSIAGPMVDDELCGEHLREMLRQMDELNRTLEHKRRSPEDVSPMADDQILLSLVLDSFGRYESGSLRGRVQMAGSYDECRIGQLRLNASGPDTPTRFCWARLKLDRYMDPMFTIAKERPDYVLSVGVCVPETCHSKNLNNYKDLMQKIVDSQFKLPESIYTHGNFELDKTFCLPDPGSKFKITFLGKLLITFLIGWICTVAFYTWQNRRSGASQKSEAIAALDIYESWREFITIRDVPDDKIVDLNTLCVFKVFCSFIILVGHSFLLQAVNALDQLEFCRNFELDFLENLLLGTTINVETFYVISGLLSCYIVLKKFSKPFEKHKSGSTFNRMFFQGWFLIVIGRYLRLVPIYFLLYIFKKEVLLNTSGYGPFWDYGFNKETLAGGCRQESWWTPLTLQSAYLPMPRQCMQVAWSISGDTILSFLTAPVILLMIKKPRISVVVSAVLSLYSIIVLHKSTGAVHEPMLTDMANSRPFAVVRMYKLYSNLYSNPKHHIYAVFIGVLAGYALYRYEMSGKSRGWPFWMRGPATLISVVTCLIIYAIPGIVAYLKSVGILIGDSLSPDASIHYFITCRFIYAICNAVIMLRMVTDWRTGSWGSFNSNRIFQYWSKLNLVFLLIQCEIITYYLDNRVSLEAYNKPKLFGVAIISLLSSFAVALPIHILIESPIDKITRALLMPKEAKKTPVKKDAAQTEIG